MVYIFRVCPSLSLSLPSLPLPPPPPPPAQQNQCVYNLIVLFMLIHYFSFLSYFLSFPYLRYPNPPVVQVRVCPRWSIHTPRLIWEASPSRAEMRSPLSMKTTWSLRRPYLDSLQSAACHQSMKAFMQAAQRGCLLTKIITARFFFFLYLFFFFFF